MKLIFSLLYLQICIVHSIEPEPPFIPITQFEFLTTEKSFIDKTMFIKDFLDPATHTYHLVTGPEKFGKSTIIDMLKRFVEMYINVLGTAYDKRLTDNYLLFTNGNVTLKITQYADFIEQHLGEYPTLYIDFDIIVEIPKLRHFVRRNVQNFDELMRRIGRLFRLNLIGPYLFLYKSLKKKKYSTDEQRLQKHTELELFWTMYQKEYLNEADIVESFNLMASLLHEYLGKKIILLVDHYDTPVREAIVEDMDVRRVYHTLYNAYSKLLENGHVSHAFFTGTLEMPMPSIVKHVRFLENHQFSQYYGLSVDELNILYERLDPEDYPFYEEERTDIDAYYKKYHIRNTLVPVYNTWDLVCYHKDRYLQYSWAQEVTIYGICSFLKLKPIREETAKLLESKQVHFELIHNISIDDLHEYQNIIHRRIDIVQPFHIRFYFTCLFVFGFFTHTDQENTYKLVNDGIEHELKSWMVSTSDPVRPPDKA